MITANNTSTFQLDSEALALAIAQEWDSQKELINIPLMRLTGLAFTTAENPYNETRRVFFVASPILRL